MKEMFISFKELEQMEYDYNIEDNGMSGQHIGYHWYTATDEDKTIELYVK